MLTDLGVHPLVELAIRLVDVDTMTALHVHFMNEPGPTDVLAFPMDELHDRMPVILPKDDAQGLTPAFSPDGKYLMWSSKRTKDGTTQLFIAKYHAPDDEADQVKPTP